MIVTFNDSEASGQARSGIRLRQIISLGILFAAIAIVTGFAWHSVTLMVTTWLSISAYNHGLFIIPIAAFMAWERRYRLIGITLEPFWPGLLLVAGFCVVWLVAHGASILEGEQIAYIGIIQGLILTILGRTVFRAQLLPILYLWLMVPTGSFMLPTLQAIATWLAANFLALTSIPFFVEQFYIQLPVGLFLVAPGCAGLNFILASLALSIVYADLMYLGWRRKLICIFTWLGVAVIANGFRIFAILWLAEITNKQLAIVDDHILYGWGFFFVILVGLMLAGQRFSNMPPTQTSLAPKDWLPTGSAALGATVAASAVSVALISGMMGYGLTAFAEGIRKQGITLSPPDSSAGWRVSDDSGYPDTAFPNADTRHVWRFENAGVQANLFVAYYDGQWDGHEAAADNNNIFGSAELKITGRAAPEPELNGARRRVQEETVSGLRSNVLVWRWYCVGDYFTVDSLVVRLRTAASRFLMRDSSTTVFSMFALESSTTRDEMTSLMQAIASANPGIMVRDEKGNAIRKISCW